MTAKPKTYRFLSGEDNADFCQRVSDALDDGYVLYGDPVLLLQDGRRIVGQAIIRADRASSVLSGDAVAAVSEPD